MDKLTLLGRARVLAHMLGVGGNVDKCAICGTVVEVQGHHLYPKHLGGPEDGPLVSLCSLHHLMIHNLVSGKPIPVGFSPQQEHKIKLLVEMIRRAKQVNEDLDPTLIDRKITATVPHGLLQRLHKRKSDLGYSNVNDYVLYLVAKDCAAL